MNIQIITIVHYWIDKSSQYCSCDAFGICHCVWVNPLQMWMNGEWRMLLISSMTGQDSWCWFYSAYAIERNWLNEVCVDNIAINLKKTDADKKIKNSYLKNDFFSSKSKTLLVPQKDGIKVRMWNASNYIITYTWID